MERKSKCGVAVAILLGCLGMAIPVDAQMSMPGMENSVGFLSSGTSIQPKAASETESMIHTSFGNWTFMFHANAFVADTQQTGSSAIADLQCARADRCPATEAVGVG